MTLPPSRPANLSSEAATDPQGVYLNRARSCIRQTLNQYTTYFRAARQQPPTAAIQTELKADLDGLALTLRKLEERVVRVAVFGLVSRGKSAVLNALIGRKQLPTGPLNGVTLAPQSVFWSPENRQGSEGAIAPNPALQVELIDTPGLDEIEGQARAQMAQSVARQADLILFVVSGDITRTEYQALCDLRQAQKPLLLVFNKIDLYPERSRQAIYGNLQRLAQRSSGGQALQELLSVEEIVLVAAEPTPIQVRVEHPDGRVTYEWDAPPIQIEALKDKLLELLQREGRSLMALNALFQTQQAERRLASQMLDLRQAEAEALIWRFVRYKAIAVAVNPIAVLDLVGGAVSDLAMIRALSELYGLPVTRHEARKLWRTVLLSSGGLMLSELGSGLLLGLGKSAAAAAAGVDSSSGFTAYAGAAIAQATLAGYGAYAVGQAVQVYLERGCSWGPQGASTVIQDILSQLDNRTILYRLRQELSQQLGL